MALSRFWTWMLIISILYIGYFSVTGNIYDLGMIINGKQGELITVGETDSSQISPLILSQISQAGENGYINNDTCYTLSNHGTVVLKHGKQKSDGLFVTCRNTMTDLWLPLIGYLTFFCGLLQLLSDSDAAPRLARFLNPVFNRIFPELPPGHPAYGFMTLNFAANFLGLDNAATPFGLKAMESMQESNSNKTKASNSQIMFLCLHAAGLTLIPTSIIGYRAAQHASNPSDILIPCIITSMAGTLAALILVSIKQKINLFNIPILLVTGSLSVILTVLMFYISQLTGTEKLHFTGNLSNMVLLVIIALIIIYSVWKEKLFQQKNTTIFDSFIAGASEGLTTGIRVLPYMIAMLAALSIFRNSGLMDIFMQGIQYIMSAFHINPAITDAIPVALMRPFSAGGSRGFMLDAMKTFGPDSLTGRLSCLFQGAAETTFYVIALYFGSVGVKNTRYTLGIMLLVDFICIITGIFISLLYF